MSSADICSPCGVVIVNQSEVKTIEQCGAFTGVAHPGCHCLIPCLCRCVNQTLSMRQQQLHVACETKTKDNVFVTVKVAVQYQINMDDESIKAAAYRLTNARDQIESYVFDVVRSSVPKIELDDVFETKDQISDSINTQLTSSMSKFGYSILASPITDIDPDAQVKRAMNEINKMKRLRVAAGVCADLTARFAFLCSLCRPRFLACATILSLPRSPLCPFSASHPSLPPLCASAPHSHASKHAHCTCIRIAIGRG
uniref:Band 7 domain-containing protein n=1 Tax=Calcidiscus leptoporus TaxID=127549 RepID=A0A6U5FVH8_9EUKA